MNKGAEMIAEYRQSAAHTTESLAAGNSPDFATQYRYEVMTDRDDFFVFWKTAVLWMTRWHRPGKSITGISMGT